MTITCQPMDATSGAPAYSAQNERQNMSVLYGGGSGVVLGARSGWRVGTPSNVLTVTATQWTLAPCSAVINPGAATAQGAYRWSTDANVTAANNLNAADSTNTRIDIVYIQINDSSSGDASGALSAPVLYAAGVPSATPAAPALPPRSFLVGTITVPKVGGGAPTVVVNTAAFVAAGAPLPVFSVTERDALTKYDGLTVQRRDVAGRPTETWDGSQWWVNGTIPINTNAANFYNAPAGYGPLTLAVSGKIANLTGNVTWANAGGSVLCQIPAPYLPAYEVSFTSVSQNNLTGALGTTYRGVVATSGAATLNWMGVARDVNNIIPIQATWLIA